MSWSYECIEDPTDAMNEDDEYMFDEYIDMMIDRARGHDQANPYIGCPYWIYRGKQMTRRQHWAKLAKDFKKNGRPFHYQYLIRKEDD